MMRVAVIVSLWILLTGGVGDAMLSGERPRWMLTALYFAMNAATALAVWAELARPERPGRGRRWKRWKRAYD